MGQSGIRAPKQTRALKTMEKIRLSAHETIVSDGFSALSIRNIANAANVGVGSVYEYFGSREGLVRAIYQDRFQKKFDAFDEELLVDSPLGATERLGRYYLRLNAEGLISTLDLALWQARETDTDAAELAAKFQAGMLDRYIAFAVKFGKGSSKLEIEVLAKFNLAIEHAGMGVALSASPDEIQFVRQLQFDITCLLLEHAGVDLDDDWKSKQKNLF